MKPKEYAKIAREFRAGRGYGKQVTPTGLPATAAREPSDLEQHFDGVTEGPGIWKWRHYFDIYDRHFSKFRGRPVKIVEIGIFSGGSLGMWLSYFGPESQVIGLDIEPSCMAYASDKVQVFIGDQADRQFLDRVVAEVGSFDIVVDDGGHEAYQQMPTFEALWPALSPGGVYLCEDVHTDDHSFNAYMQGFASNLHTLRQSSTDNVSPATDFQATVAGVHTYPYVWVVEKRAARMDQLEAPRHGTSWQPFYGDRLTFPS